MARKLNGTQTLVNTTVICHLWTRVWSNIFTEGEVEHQRCITFNLLLPKSFALNYYFPRFCDGLTII